MPTRRRVEVSAICVDPVANVVEQLHSAAQSAAEWCDYWNGIREKRPESRLSYYLHPGDSRLRGAFNRLLRKRTGLTQEQKKTLDLAIKPFVEQLARIVTQAQCKKLTLVLGEVMNTGFENRISALDQLYGVLAPIYSLVVELEPKRLPVAPSRQSLKQASEKPTQKRKRNKDWRQADAANLAGVSTRELRRWDKGVNAPADYPGWRDAIVFKAWLSAREGKSRLNRALKNHASYQEGVTEKYRER